MRWVLATTIAFAAISLAFLAPVQAADAKESSRHREVIVQSANLDEATEAIDAVGGVVSHELKVIHAVGVRLTEEQITQLRKRAKDLKLRIYTDFPQVRVDGGSKAAKAAEKAAKEAEKAAKEAEKAAKEAEKAAEEAAKEAEEAAKEAAEQAEESAKEALKAAEEAEKAREKAEKEAEKGKADDDKQAEAKQAEREAAEAAARAAAAEEELRQADEAAAAAEAFQEAARASYEMTRVRQQEINREAKKRIAERRRRDKDARWGLNTEYPTLIDADKLHKSGIDGSGVTIAVIDTGIWTKEAQVAEGLATNGEGRDRILAQYNAMLGESISGSIADQLSISPSLANDGYGHGTHVASVAVSSLTEGRSNGKSKGKGNDNGSVLYNGIAPNADLVVVKAFDDGGLGSYLDVIRAVDWVIQNQGAYGIRVLNLSFSGEPRSYYWDDPLNQAVMAAWQSGIVVVASAGNRGPDPMTVGVPGNTPYVITVGAMSDSMSNSPSDDFLASFSSTGPTFEGFVKPEMVAPGGHVMGLMSEESQIAIEHPEFHDGGNYFVMSGTSQSTAIVSGVAALMLQADPTLTPDEIKCRLMASARPAAEKSEETEEMWLAYSVFQQGAGLVNARDAVETLASSCANQGLNIELDLLGKQHYRGRANFSETDGFFLEGLQGDGYLWNDGYLWSDGHKFRDEFVWPDGFLWSDGYLWNDGFLWNDGYLWSDGFLWNDAETQSMSTNAWVPQE